MQKTILVLSKKYREKIINPSATSKKVTLSTLGFSRYSEFEDFMLQTFNKQNDSFKLSEIQYEDNNFSSVFTGEIVIENEDKYRQTIAYAFISTLYTDTRNAMFSQQIFPGLSSLISKYIDSPGYTFANLPVYFINCYSKGLEANSVQTNIIGAKCMDINFISLFSDLEYVQPPKSLLRYARRVNPNFKQIDDLYETKFFSINTEKKILTFTTDQLPRKSFGSSDRFYVMRAYPALLLADKERYQVDISKVEKFYQDTNNGKSNLLPFLKFAKKLKDRKRF